MGQKYDHKPMLEVLNQAPIIADLELSVGDRVVETAFGGSKNVLEVTGVSQNGTVTMEVVEGPRMTHLDRVCVMGDGASAQSILKL